MANALDPVTAFVRGLEDDYYLLREAAEECGMSVQVLRRAVKDGQEAMQPSNGVMIGKMKVYLYTREDIDRMKQALADRRDVKTFDEMSRSPVVGGRPSVYTPEEKAERARLFSRLSYWRNKYRECSDAGNKAETKYAKKIINELEEAVAKGTKRSNSSALRE